MFGFLKGRMRKEHLRLVSENRRMAAEIQRLASTAAQVMGDAEAARVNEAMNSAIGELDKLATWLDRNDYLTPEMASYMLELYKNLASQVAEIEQGRAAARRLFKE